MVRDQELGILLVALRVPHLTRGADSGGHRGVDDHVARDVEVGDPPVGVDHGQRRPVLIGRVNRVVDGFALVVGEGMNRFEQRSQTVIGVDAGSLERGAVLLEEVLEVGAEHVPEDDRVRHPHHRGLEMDREEDASLLGILDLLGQEGLESCAAHHGGVDDLAVLQLDRLLEDRHCAVPVEVLDANGSRALDGVRALGRAEVLGAHRRDVRFRI